MVGRPKRSQDVDFVCPQCGVHKVLPDYEAKRRKFCSRECFHAAGGSGGPAKKEATPQVCPTCEKTFFTGGTGRPKRGTMYCSIRCYSLGTWRQAAPRELTPQEVAWFAGVVDSEGSIVFPRKNSRSCRLTVHNTNKEFIDRVAELSGTGTIIPLAKYKQKAHHKDAWVWQCNGENARILLRQMLPHLIIKREKALAALENYSSG